MTDSAHALPGALAWRPDIEMTKGELDEFLSARLIARVATNGSGGFPLVTPLWYLWDGVALYISTTSNRLAGKNLLRDPRCAVLIDWDDRGVFGMGTNQAKAVHILGEAELIPNEPGNKVRIEGGPAAGLHEAQDAIKLITRRYNLHREDGSVGFTQDDLIEKIAAGEIPAAAEDSGRMIAKVVPRRLRSWDFTKGRFV